MLAAAGCFSGEFMSLLTSALIHPLLAAAQDSWRLKEFLRFLLFLLYLPQPDLVINIRSIRSNDLQAAKSTKRLQGFHHCLRPSPHCTAPCQLDPIILRRIEVPDRRTVFILS